MKPRNALDFSKAWKTPD